MPRSKRQRDSDYGRSAKRYKKAGSRFLPFTYGKRKYKSRYNWKKFSDHPGQVLGQNREYAELRNTYATKLTSSGAGVLAGELIRLNDCYDPFITGGANAQPLGWDNLTPQLYDRYRVYSGTAKVTVAPWNLSGVNQPILMVMWLSRSNVDVLTLRDAQCQPGARTMVIPRIDRTAGFGTDIPKTMYFKWDISEFIQREEVVWSAYSASPATATLSVLYLNYWISFMDGTALANSTDYLAINMEMTQHTELARRTANFIPPS